MRFIYNVTNTTKFLNQISEELGYQITGPTESVGWVNEAEFRGTLELVWTCVFTLFACLWASLHLNIPGPDDTECTKYLRKLKWTFLAATFPEVVVSVAFVNWWDTRRDVAMMKEHGFNWDKKLCAFVRMGGVWLRGKPGSESATDASLANQEKTKGTPLICTETDILRTLIQSRILDEDCLTRRVIDEKSKSDWVVKLIACWQALYFGIQCIGRWGSGLPLTALELSTVVFTTYALALYLLWWHKPVDVAMPVVFDVSQQALDHVWRHHDLSAPRSPWWTESFAWNNLKDTTSIEIRRIPNSFSSTGGLRRDICLYPMLLSSFLFSGLHFLAWNFDFPTKVEQDLWRLSCIIMAAEPPLSTLLYILGSRRQWFRLDFLLNGVWLISMILYVAARFYLIVEVFVCLRVMPAGCYQTVDWIGSIPHIG
ncbi:hypothetical protein K449DRAFT_386465 [Hypoxylon sp. EC38]|nr:hypothetical protein K449DRAFT_386465 [Hypoxylon sp. EC38]